MNLNLDKSKWKTVKLSDVVKNINVSVKNPILAGIERTIAMEHLDPGELQVKRWGNVADGTNFTRLVKPGQTLFGKRRAYQRKVAYADFEAVTSGDILVFEANPKLLLPEFLPFIVQSERFFQHALQTSAGSLSPRTNWRDLAAYEFNLPPTIDEQRDLAQLLWVINRHIHVIANIRLGLNKLKTALLHTVISQSNKYEPLGNILLDVLDRRGITPHKLGSEFTKDGIPVISAMNIRNDEIDYLAQERYVSEEIATKWMRSWLRFGDIIMTSEAPLGSAVIVSEDLKVCLGQRLFALRPNRAVIEPEFLFAFISSSVGQSELAQRASGTTVSGIRQSELRKIKVPIPKCNQQIKFLSQWGELKVARGLLAEELVQLRTLRILISKQIFGGEE